MIHNFYGKDFPSGENQVFLLERHMLESRGHIVDVFIRQSDEIRRQGLWGSLQAAMSVIWNPWVNRAILRKVEEFKPDIVHVHNTFPLIANGIFKAIGTKARVILSLHNYRIFCPNALLMRNSSVCTECLDKRSVLPSLMHACYRESLLATIPISISVALHQYLRTWSRWIDGYIVSSEFQKKMLQSARIPSDKIFIKYNSTKAQIAEIANKDNVCIFVGRLSKEKGITTLIDAWRIWGKTAPLLLIIGDGPLKAEIEKKTEGLNVKLCGGVSLDVVSKEISKSKLLIVPSEWFEGFPMIIPTAFAVATPIAVSQLGALDSIVKADKLGVIFPPANPQRLYEVVSTLWRDKDKLRQLGLNALKEYEEKYTEDSNYAQLMAIYEQSIKMNPGN